MEPLSKKRQRLAARKLERQADGTANAHRKRRNQRTAHAASRDSNDSLRKETSIAYAACGFAECTRDAGCVERHVTPYVHAVRAFAKRRWCGLPLRDVLVQEFGNAFSSRYYVSFVDSIHSMPFSFF